MGKYNAPFWYLWGGVYGTWVNTMHPLGTCGDGVYGTWVNTMHPLGTCGDGVYGIWVNTMHPLGTWWMARWFDWGG